MRTAIAAALSIALTAGCDSSARSGEWPSLRQQRDPASDRVWRLTYEGLTLYSRAGQERTSVALPGWLWADEPYSCPPDVAIGPRGEALVTSNVVPTLWKIDPVTLAVTVHPLKLNVDQDKDVGFTGLVFSPRHGAFFGLSDTYGSLWRIDPMLTSASKIASGPARPRRMPRSGHPRSLPCGDVSSHLLSLGG